MKQIGYNQLYENCVFILNNRREIDMMPTPNYEQAVYAKDWFNRCRGGSDPDSYVISMKLFIKAYETCPEVFI
ncbi:hypothetical protein [Vibrio phage phiKT1024]|nr:hypothetical protein [Vibrio phage phiKT1024]